MTNAPAAEAKMRIANDSKLPQSVKDFVDLGIEALMETFGDEVLVCVSLNGHLHLIDDETTSSLSVHVYKAS